MAVIPYTWTEFFSPLVYVDVIRWDNLQGASGDTGQPFLTGVTPISSASLSDKCVHFLNAGSGLVLLEGTNDVNQTAWATLTSPGDVDLTNAARLVQQVLQNPLLIRPRVSGAATNVSVIVVAKRPHA